MQKEMGVGGGEDVILYGIPSIGEISCVIKKSTKINQMQLAQAKPTFSF